MGRLLPLNKNPGRVGGALVGGGGSGFSSTKFSLLASTAVGAAIGTLSKPFGSGTTFVDVSGDAVISFNATTGVFTRAAGAISEGDIKSRKVRAVSPDGTREVAETITFSVGAGVSVPAPSFSLSSALTQAEGNSGTTAFVWTLTLNRDGSTAAHAFAWAITGSGTYPADAADFGGTFPSGSGTFAPGETVKTITVLVTGDTAVEPDETFTLTVTGLNTVTSTGTISNDDAAPVTLGNLALSGTITNGSASSGTITGATVGSTITSNVTGLTVNSGARTYSWSGAGAAGTTANGLVETLGGATNSPKSNSITVAAAPAYSFTNAEAQQYVARMSPTPDDSWKAIYDGFIGRLKVGTVNGSALITGGTGGVLTGAFDKFHIRGGHSSQAGLLDMMGGASSTLSTVAPMFHAGYGFTSDGVQSYVEWGSWTPATGVQYQQNNASFGFHARNPDTSATTIPEAGCTSGNLFICAKSNSGYQYRINGGTVNAGTPTDGAGLCVVTRTDASNVQAYRGATLSGSNAANTSAVRPAVNVREGNAFVTFCQDQLLVSFAGRALTANEVADLNAAVEWLKTQIGWQALIPIPAATFAAISAAATSTLPTLANIISSPDAVPIIVTGKGFTNTGAARDTDGTFWVSAFGRNVQGDTTSTSQPYVVHLAADRSTVLGTIDLAAIGVTGGLQGLCVDTATNTLWVNMQNVIANVSKDGTTKLSSFAVTGGNGIAYDSTRDKLVNISTGGGHTYLNKDGTATGVPAIPATGPGADQSTYCADIDAFVTTMQITSGGNLSYAYRIKWNGQNYGAPRYDRVDILPGATQIEGIVRYFNGTQWIFVVWNDFWYHGNSSAPANSSGTYPSPY